MFVTLTLHRLLGARPVKYGIRGGIMALMLLVMMCHGFYLIPQVDALQAQVNGTDRPRCRTPTRGKRGIQPPARTLEHPASR